MLTTAVILAVVAVGSSAVSVKLHPLSDAFIDHINSKQSSWTAGRNFPLDTPLRKLVGTHQKSTVSLPRKTHDNAELKASLPENFDPRDEWGYCRSSLNEIRDQASCGSCWAFAAVEAMTDRVCIYSEGKKQFHFSAEDLISCCSYCGSCHGGNPTNAWLHWSYVGIVSGGNYNSSEGCKPYPFPSCQTLPHPKPNLSGLNENDAGEMPPCLDYKGVKTPKCSKSCVSDELSYEKDLTLGLNPYEIEGEEDIKAELYQYGPVEGTFKVYEDFFSYKTGVYSHVAGDFVYGHAVKILGWGVEDGIKYWLVANSWNEGWGDKGFFKILRGENHLGIESYAIAAIPDLPNV